MKLHNLSHAALLTFIFLSHTALATKGLDPAQTGDNPTPPSAQSAPAPVQPAAPAQPQSGGWFPWLSSTPATPQAGEAPPPVSSAFTPTASGWTFWPFGGGNPAPASAEPAAQNPAELTPDDGDFVIVPPGGDQSAPSDPHQFPNADTTEPLAEATQDEDDATAFQPPEAAALPPSVEDYPLFARRSDPSSRLTLQQNPLLTGRLSPSILAALSIGGASAALDDPYPHALPRRVESQAPAKPAEQPPKNRGERRAAEKAAAAKAKKDKNESAGNPSKLTIEQLRGTQSLPKK